MKTLQIFDPAMCCSTGVCGPQVDPALVRFAADLKWLQEQGVEVQRVNLAQNPAAFVENEMVRAALTEKGESALPMLLLDGHLLASGKYPERAQLAEALGLNSGAASLLTPAVMELVAIGAAIASNCEPCLRYHVNEAGKLGVSTEDMAAAVDLAQRVKDAPHQAILRLASRLIPVDRAEASGCCSGSKEDNDGGGCCGGSDAAASGAVAKGGCCS